jgi:hypothetical protein
MEASTASFEVPEGEERPEISQDTKPVLGLRLTHGVFIK